MTMFARARCRTFVLLALLPALAGALPLAAALPAERTRSVGQLDPVAPDGRITGRIIRSRSDAYDDSTVTITVTGIRESVTMDVDVDPWTRTFSSRIDTGLCRYRACSVTASVAGGDSVGGELLELDNSPQSYIEPTPPPPGPPTWGLDLTNRCISSPNPDGENALPVSEECAGGPAWTLGLQAERTLGISCSGPASQSIPVNVQGSPARFQWFPYRDRGDDRPSTAYLRVDTLATPHPCGAGHFTWFAFMDHVVHGGGPFPPLAELHHRVTLRYDARAAEGKYRVFLSASAFWDGQHHIVEMHVAGPGWGALSTPDTDVINAIRTDVFTFVHLDGAFYGLTLEKSQARSFSVNWAYIFYQLIERGLLPRPSRGIWGAATGSVSAGVEIFNAAASNAALTELWISDWRVTDEGRLPGPSGN